MDGKFDRQPTNGSVVWYYKDEFLSKGKVVTVGGDNNNWFVEVKPLRRGRVAQKDIIEVPFENVMLDLSVKKGRK